MGYDDEALAAELRALMKLRKVSLRSLSDTIKVPYRSMQNYLAGESRMPAVVLVKALDALGSDLKFLRTRDYLLQHGDMYDAVISVFGDLLAEIDLEDIGRRSLDARSELDKFQKLQVNASELAVRLSEAYDRYAQDHVLHGPYPTIKELRAKQAPKDDR